eukprot:TRINITY_DN29595_c0_g1_i1.p1 TRINITY_DN29595_c0_g1~~TRINITY_DN29595_c0_g1_i1.p1  ORF type:complete len:557 (+),score=66.22 TRINITY_DN29595_c0_g1_i1:79-1749(+)
MTEGAGSSDWRVLALRGVERVFIAVALLLHRRGPAAVGAAAEGPNRLALGAAVRRRQALLLTAAAGAVLSQHLPDRLLTLWHALVLACCATAATLWLRRQQRWSGSAIVMQWAASALWGAFAAAAARSPPPARSSSIQKMPDSASAAPAAAAAQPAAPRTTQAGRRGVTCDPELYGGGWTLDLKQSEDINPLMTAMGLPWVVRKLVAALEIVFFFRFDRGSGATVELTTRTESFLVFPRRRLLALREDPVPLDGHWHRWTGPDGLEGWAAGAIDAGGALQVCRDGVQVAVGRHGRFRMEFRVLNPGELRVALSLSADDDWVANYRGILRRVAPASAAPLQLLSDCASQLPSAGPPDGSESEGDEALEGSWRPDLTGHWRIDAARSDGIDALLRVAEVPWVARRVACQLDMTFRYRHTPRHFTIEVRSLMTATERQTLDGVPRRYDRADGNLMTVCAEALPGGGVCFTRVRSDECIPTGGWARQVEHRELVARRRARTTIVTTDKTGKELLRWRVELTPVGEDPAGPDPAAVAAADSEWEHRLVQYQLRQRQNGAAA